ncbi:MAG TPA: hypothetical protein DEE98_01100 [Elusimicrobia bacterium]|nr:MAG: hypothetical protein A2204_00400 [Elusimicrobia bacterium RIFOXYA1_FULL_47_7]HBU68962.1 hypothetical protein [Elusimicrobiota bacterium]
MKKCILVLGVTLLFFAAGVIAADDSNNPTVVSVSLSKNQITVIDSVLKQYGNKPENEHLNTIRQMGAPAVEELKKRAKNSRRDWVERVSCIGILEAVDGVNSTDTLYEILSDQSARPYVRMTAARSLGRIGRERDKVLFEKLKMLAAAEKKVEVRRDIVYSTGKVGQKEAILYLVGIINGNEDIHVKYSAIFGLGEIHDDSVNKILIDGLENGSDELSITYADVVKKRRVREAVPIILEKLRILGHMNDTASGGRRIAFFDALGSIGDNSIIAELKQFTFHDNLLISEDACVALLKLGDTSQFDYVLKRAKVAGEANMEKRLRSAFALYLR